MTTTNQSTPVLQYTWATLPTPASYGPGLAYISDIGINGSVWYSNGSVWIPTGRVALFRSNSPHERTGTTIEGNLVTHTIPGKLLGDSGRLEIYTLWSHTNNANVKNARIKVGNSTIWSRGYATTDKSQSNERWLNRNSQSNQVIYNATASFGTATPGNTSTTVDTSVSQTIAITAQVSNASDSIILEAYEIELRR